MSRLNHTPEQGSLGSRGTIAAALFAVVAAIFLLFEHRAHVLGVLPYVLLLACPLLHFFHHSGHGGGHSRHGGDAGHGSHAEPGSMVEGARAQKES
jgi:hypothetical protein